MTMWYDVMIRVHETANGKQGVVIRRVALPYLNRVLRVVQDEGMYILGVIPLFKKKVTESMYHPNDDDYDEEDTRI